MNVFLSNSLKFCLTIALSHCSFKTAHILSSRFLTLLLGQLCFLILNVFHWKIWYAYLFQVFSTTSLLISVTPRFVQNHILDVNWQCFPEIYLLDVVPCISNRCQPWIFSVAKTSITPCNINLSQALNFLVTGAFYTALAARTTENCVSTYFTQMSQSVLSA